MTTHRRRFLRLCGVAGIGAIAGCSDGEQGGAPTSEQTPTDPATSVQSPTATLTPTPTPTETSTVIPTETPTAGYETQEVAPADGDSNDQFGSSVALSSDGSTALIGADNDEDPNGSEAGSAYVFDNSGGSWTQQAKLTADDGGIGDIFGYSVALSSDGDTALVSARDDDSNGGSSGSAYVFDRSGGSWTQQTKLTPDDGDSDDSFGASVALSSDGDTALIGANGDDDPNGENAGSAYVFDSAGGSWAQQSKLFPDDGDSRDFFGSSVTLSSEGSTALISADHDDDPNGEDAGSAYVFDSSSGSWTQQAKIAPDDGDSGNLFGTSVTLSSEGSTALIGAYEDSGGSAYVFDSAGGSWTQQAKLDDEGNSDNRFGWSVALSREGSTALIGAYEEGDPNGEFAGSAYVFDTSGGSWAQQSKLFPDDGDSEDDFGYSVALSGEGSTALIGAPGDEDPNGEEAGSAYVFE